MEALQELMNNLWDIADEKPNRMTLTRPYVHGDCGYCEMGQYVSIETLVINEMGEAIEYHKGLYGECNYCGAV